MSGTLRWPATTAEFIRTEAIAKTKNVVSLQNERSPRWGVNVQ